MLEQQDSQTAELKGMALKTLGPAGVLIVGSLLWVQDGLSDLGDQMVSREVFDARMESVVESQRALKVEMQLLGQRVQGIESDLSYFRGAAETKDASK